MSSEHGGAVDVIAREVIAQIVEVQFADHWELVEEDFDEGVWLEVEARILVLIDGMRPVEGTFDRAYEKLWRW